MSHNELNYPVDLVPPKPRARGTHHEQLRRADQRSPSVNKQAWNWCGLLRSEHWQKIIYSENGPGTTVVLSMPNYCGCCVSGFSTYRNLRKKIAAIDLSGDEPAGTILAPQKEKCTCSNDIPHLPPQLKRPFSNSFFEPSLFPQRDHFSTPPTPNQEHGHALICPCVGHRACSSIERCTCVALHGRVLCWVVLFLLFTRPSLSQTPRIERPNNATIEVWNKRSHETCSATQNSKGDRICENIPSPM